MKRIRQLTKPPSLMQDYLDQLSRRNEVHDWKKFRANCRDGYQQLQDVLLDLQQGLCAYCEIRITPRRTMEIEHYRPKAGKPERHLDIGNLLGGCGKSDNPTIGYPARDPANKGHFKPPAKIHSSCGAKKGKGDPSQLGSRILDPRTVPVVATTQALPRLVRYLSSSGELEADDEGCRTVGIDPNVVTETIKKLNLNSERLADERKEVWTLLQTAVAPNLSQDEAADQLCPDKRTGHLAPFWSTVRFYFADVAEAWLATEEAKAALC